MDTLISSVCGYLKCQWHLQPWLTGDIRDVWACSGDCSSKEKTLVVSYVMFLFRFLLGVGREPAALTVSSPTWWPTQECRRPDCRPMTPRHPLPQQHSSFSSPSGPYLNNITYLSTLWPNNHSDSPLPTEFIWNHGNISVADPSTWNSLPDSLRDQAMSLSIFRRHLKTLFFVKYWRDVLSALDFFNENALYNFTLDLLTYINLPNRTLKISWSCLHLCLRFSLVQLIIGQVKRRRISHLNMAITRRK